MTNVNAEPQSCYPEEIETLREMLADERAMLATPIGSASFYRAKHEKRIEALRTAIEALGGAL